MSNEERTRVEVEEHANAVFGRLAANPRRRRRQRERAPRAEAPQADWFSGIEAALPKGDRD